MGLPIHPVTPFEELLVHVWVGGEPVAKEKVFLHEFDGVLDFSFCLRVIGFTDAQDKTVVGEEILKLCVPSMILGPDGSFDDDRLDVVVEDFIRNPAKVVKCVLVALDQCVYIC